MAKTTARQAAGSMTFERLCGGCTVY